MQNNQYAEIGDDGDTYIDLKNAYKVVDDEIRETMVDNGARKVKYKIKKDNDGRFDADHNLENITVSTATGAAVSVVNTTKAGWLKNTDITWSYINVDGTRATGWINDN